MFGAKLLRIGLALVVAIPLLALNMGSALASDGTVVQSVETVLVPTTDAPFGATGMAELSLTVGASSSEREFDIDVEAAGLRPGVNHFVFLGNRFIGFQRADIFGRIAIEREIDDDIPFFLLRRLPIFVNDDIGRTLLFGRFGGFEEEDDD